MEYIKKSDIVDYLISTIFSILITCLIYKILYPLFKYINLDDFYSGTSIYLNHNKNLDVGIYFIYLFIFFIIVSLSCFLRNKIFKTNSIKIEDNKNNQSIENKNKRYNVFFKLQYLFIPCFYLLHPINGILYPKLITLITLIVVISCIDIYIKNKNNEGLSPFTIAAMLLLLYFNTLSADIFIDEHHMGETFATYFLHTKFNMQYYIDLMLVHGYIDVLPAQIGTFFFNENNLYSYIMGNILFKNLMLIINSILCINIFKHYKITAFAIMSLILSIQNFQADIVLFFTLVYILFLEKNIHPLLKVTLYTITSIIFAQIWTTIGIFWIISTLPFTIYDIFNNFKNGYKYKYLLIISPAIILTSFLFLNLQEILSFINEASQYAKATLYVFGNNFPAIDLSVRTLIVFIELNFSLIILPYFIIELLRMTGQKEKNKQQILFLLFAIILPIVSLKYTMGRIDGISYKRLLTISYTYLFFLFTYYIYKYKQESLKRCYFVILIVTALFVSIMPVVLTFNKKIEYINNSYEYYSKNYLSNESFVPKQNLNYYYTLQNYIKPDTIYADLSNRGMNYLFFNKKMNRKFVSFYNIATTEQADKAENKLPDIITIFSNNSKVSDDYLIDDIYPSLKTNYLYRRILLNNNYKLNTFADKAFLTKTNGKLTYTDKDFQILDSTLANDNLMFLPEVWANSLKTLPIYETEMAFKTENIDDTKNIIQTSFSGRNTDFIYIESEDTTEKEQSYEISVNDSRSILYCSSESGKILIPLDNFPSWLLNENINEIQINTKFPAKIKKVAFYNKKENIR